MFYTRNGDDGKSKTLKTEMRCNKNEPIFHALGTIDELNSLLGVCYAKAQKVESQTTYGNNLSVSTILRNIQEDLFIVQAELAGADKMLSTKHTKHIEDVIAKLTKHIENPKGFVIAGSDEFSAYLDLSRSIARRTEREVLASNEIQEISQATRVYLNRLSSALYVLARYVATMANVKEQNPSY